MSPCTHTAWDICGRAGRPRPPPTAHVPNGFRQQETSRCRDRMEKWSHPCEATAVL